MITKPMRSKLRDPDWEKQMYATGMIFLITNDEVDVEDIVLKIVKKWDFGGYFDKFGSDRGVQMVQAICNEFDNEFDFNPHEASSSAFFNLMRYMFKLIYKEAFERGLVTNILEE